jgi:hypothetical protein
MLTHQLAKALSFESYGKSLQNSSRSRPFFLVRWLQCVGVAFQYLKPSRHCSMDANTFPVLELVMGQSVWRPRD